jgi:hypothetical protein
MALRGSATARSLATVDEALATCFEAKVPSTSLRYPLAARRRRSHACRRSLSDRSVIAKRQGARSFGLRAALSLAKLYQSTALPLEAHAVLAPALEGFAPTREFPEIEEALEMIAAIEAGAHL